MKNAAERFMDKVERPVGSNVLIRKCAIGEQVGDEFLDGGIVLPDTVWDNTNFVEIVGVGPRCKLYTEDMIGSVTWCPEGPESLCQAGCPESFHWIKEKDLVPLLFDDHTISPIKDMVVIEIRPLTIDGVDIAERHDTYDPWGTCVSIGPKVFELKVGDECLVSEKSFIFMVGEKLLTCIPESKIAAIKEAAA